METPYYTVRGNRSFTTMSLHDDDEDGKMPTTDDWAIAVAENVAYQWNESVTVLRDDQPVCVVLPDRGF